MTAEFTGPDRWYLHQILPPRVGSVQERRRILALREAIGFTEEEKQLIGLQESPMGPMRAHQAENLPRLEPAQVELDEEDVDLLADGYQLYVEQNGYRTERAWIEFEEKLESLGADLSEYRQ